MGNKFFQIFIEYNILLYIILIFNIYYIIVLKNYV